MCFVSVALFRFWYVPWILFLLLDFQHDTHIYFADAPNKAIEYKVRKVADCEIDVSNVVFSCKPALSLSLHTPLFISLVFCCSSVDVIICF